MKHLKTIIMLAAALCSLSAAAQTASCALCEAVLADDPVEVGNIINSDCRITAGPTCITLDINGKDAEGDRARNALFYAAKEGYEQIIEIILNARPLNPQINAQNTVAGRTALFIAALNGHTESVRALLNHSADQTIPGNVNGKPFSPLKIALQRKRYPAAKLLAAESDAVFPKPRNIVSYALQNDITDVLEDALAHTGIPENFATSMLFRAAQLDGEDAEGLASAALDDGGDCAAYENGRTVRNLALFLGKDEFAALLAEADCPNLTEESACRDEDKLHVNNLCVECPAGQLLHDSANRCVPDFAACHDNDEIFDHNLGACRACADDGTEKRFNNECVVLPECTGGKVRAANGFTCECPAGRYAKDGKCARVCTESCSVYSAEDDECVCGPNTERNAYGKCVFPVICQPGQVRTPDMLSCRCPDNFPNAVGEFCRGEILSCGYGKHKHRPWHNNHTHAGVKWRQIGIHTGLESISACECNTALARQHGFGGEGCH